MEPTTIGLIGIIVLIVLLLSRMHIGLAMGMVGFAGFAYVAGWDAALGVLTTVPYTTFASDSLSVIPLFVLMGAFAFSCGMSEDLYAAVRTIFANLRGGLAMATVAACACFAAISGSSIATAATLGKVAMPEMRKYNYAESLACGAIAAGGCIGILIPPSVILLIYGILTEQSIGKLFAAGLIPGIMQAAFYIVTIYILTRRNPNLGPPGPSSTSKEKMVSFLRTWDVIALFLMVIGGLYAGIFTPTEAAGVGAFGAFCFALLRRRMSWTSFTESLGTTVATAGMLFTIVLGAMILGYFFSVTRLPVEFAGFVSSLPVNRYVIILCIIVVYMILGCLMDSLAIVLLTVPVFFPLVVQLGFDPIWFGVIVTRVTEMGMITPPVGMNVYVIHGITKVPMPTIFKGIGPFLVADVLQVAVLIALPQVSTFLPSLM
jgi:tripartite ATP-independent transporter DctM subunit